MICKERERNSCDKGWYGEWTVKIKATFRQSRFSIHRRDLPLAGETCLGHLSSLPQLHQYSAVQEKNSSLWASHQRRFPVSFSLWRMSWDSRFHARTVCPVNAVNLLWADQPFWMTKIMAYADDVLYQQKQRQVCQVHCRNLKEQLGI
jgi:hypothetical protein